MVDDGHKLVLVRHGKRKDGYGVERVLRGNWVHGDELERVPHDKVAHDVG